MTCIAIGVILSVTKKDEEVALDLEEKRKRDEALQQLIDAQVAINEVDPSEENQQKLEELRYSIREEVKDLEGDSLIDGENPMNSVRNKE
jgi:cell division protein FtsW